MLIRYKKAFEKIAMGLLSFMPEERDVKKLQQTIRAYESNENWHLFLWKETDVIGAIGVRIDDNINAVIQHITVNPSHRDAGIGKLMVDEVKQMYEGKYAVCSDDMTENFIDYCEADDHSKDDKDDKDTQ